MGLVRLVDLDFLSPSRTHLLVLGPADPQMLRAVVDRGPWAGLTLCQRGPSWLRWCLGGLTLARLLARLRPQLVVLSLEPANLVGRLLRPFFRQPIFCSFEHNSRYRRWLYRVIFSLLTGGIDAVLFDAHATKAGVERFYGRGKRMWIHVPLFVFDPDLPAKDDYAIADTVRILSVGRLVPAKDHPLLLRTIADLRRRGVRLTCEIVGEGPLRPFLEQLALELGVADLVTFSGQDVNWRKRARLFDIYLQTSEHEGACLTVLEAMAAGLPVVATAVGEIPAHLAEGAGIAVDGRCPSELATSISRLLDDEPARSSLGRRARTRVAELYGKNQVVSRLRAAAQLLRTSSSTTRQSRACRS